MFKLDTFVNVKTLQRDLKKIGVNIRSFRRPLTDTGKYMLKSIDRNFGAQGRPQKWVELAPMTLAMRRWRGSRSKRILQDTGKLRRSIRYRVEGSKAVYIGTNKSQARLLQRGGFVKRKGTTYLVPPRPFILFQPEDYGAIEKIFLKHISKAIKV